MKEQFVDPPSNQPVILCNGCKKPIFGPTISAMGTNWHPEHFVCASCGNQLAGQRFNHKDGKPYCADDYSKLFLERCAKCNEPIKERIIKALGKNWHEEHFVCIVCGTSLAGQLFCEKDGDPYCQKDYNERFVPRCTSCGKPIVDTAIVALGEKWHKDCFKCSKCGKRIDGNKFLVVDVKPVCEKCGGM